MRKKLLLPLLLIMAMMFVLASCGTEGGGEVGEYEDGEFIFSEKSELYLIVDEFSAGLESVYELVNTVDENKNAYYPIKFAAADSEVHKHEIIIGKSDRELTKTAERQLDRMDTNKDSDVRYLIYSDGYSIAVVFDEDSEKIAFESALAELIQLCSTNKLTLNSGTYKKETIDVYEYYDALDTVYENEKWAALAEKVGGNAGQNLVIAMKEFYSLYTNDVIVWLANLYEPAMCVCNGLYGETECKHTQWCGTGGFYYSNSARDNIGFLPDVESTYQALGFLNSSGVTRSTGSSWKRMLSDDMNASILAFVRSIQREDGYFVHPQWQNPGSSRISRDLNWATNILNTLGERPYYDTPLGLEGIGAPSGDSSLTGQLSGSNARACAKVVAAAESYLPQLKDVPTFKAYLNSLNIKAGGYSAYSAGNTLTSQQGLIRARDKELGLTGENSLYKTMINHLNETQNPANGTWDNRTPDDSDYNIYMQINALMKISGIYGTTYLMPNIDKAVETAISAITYEKDITDAVDIYNPWFALHNLFLNLEACGGSAGIEETARLRQLLYDAAPITLIATRNKISGFKKDDGSFSYGRKYSSATSQGCAAAVPNSVEGDVNGTLLSCAGLIDYIYTAMGISGDTKVPLFGDCERLMFLNEIKTLEHIDKPNTNAVITPLDFEDYEPEEIPENDGIFESKVNNSQSLISVTDRADGNGNSLLIESVAGSGDYVNIKNQSSNPAANTLVFESDFLIDSVSITYPIQVYVGEAYMFSFRRSDGMIRIVECSSSVAGNSVDNDLGVAVPFDQWFNVRVEYYYGDHDSVRIKFYLDTDLTDENGAALIAVSDNYYDKNGDKLKNPTGTPSKSYTRTQIYILPDAAVTMQIDNAVAYTSLDKFTPAVDPDGELDLNVDAVGESNKYDFENGVIPEEFGADSQYFSINTYAANKSLSISSPKAMTGFDVPVNLVKANGKCLTVSFDITCTDAKAGLSLMTLVGSEQMGNTIGFAFVTKAAADGTSLVMCEYNDSGIGAEIAGTEMPLGQTTNVKIEYYRNYRVAIIYIEDEFTAATSLLYIGGERRNPTESKFTFNGSMDYTVKIDNIVSERSDKSYLDAVKPEFDSNIRDFEENDSSVTLGQNASIAQHGGSNMAKLDSTSADSGIKIALQKRSNIISAIDVAFDLVYSGAADNGTSHKITVTDEDGNVIFGIVLVRNGDKAELYEMSRDGEPRMRVSSFNADLATSIGFELYLEEGAAYIYTGGSCVSLTTSLPYPDRLEYEAAYLNIESADAGSVLYVDNIKAETLYLVFEDKVINNLQNSETDTTLTFEKSNTSSLPSRLHYSLIGSTSSIGIETVVNDVMKQYSNAVIMTTKTGANDKIGIKPLDNEDLSSYSCVTFETDIYMDLTAGNAEKYWLYFSKNAENPSDVLYQLCIEVRSGNFNFFDRSSPDSKYIKRTFPTNVSASGWHRLKIEYFAGDSETARIRLSLDGEVVFVSDNYSGPTSESSRPGSYAKTGVRRVYFYSFGATEGDLYLDNMSLTGSDAVCTDPVTYK